MADGAAMADPVLAEALALGRHRGLEFEVIACDPELVDGLAGNSPR